MTVFLSNPHNAEPSKVAIQVCVVEGEDKDEASQMSLCETRIYEVVRGTVSVLPATTLNLLSLLIHFALY